jgi:hypothetical protein
VPALARWEHRVLTALFECVTPVRGPGELSFEGSGAVAACAALLDGLPRTIRHVLRGVLFAIEWLGILLAAVPGRFSRMSPARRARLLARVQDHPLYEVRVLYRIVTALCFTAYYSRPAVARTLGYDPDARLAYARAEPNPEGRWRPPGDAPAPLERAS